MVEYDERGNIIPESYGLPLFECPISGWAMPAEWKKFDRETMTYPGRNKPSLGQYLIQTFSKQNDIGFDPMCGVGSLWLDSIHKFKKVYLSDWSFEAFNIRGKNFERYGITAKDNVESFVLDISKSRIDTFDSEKATFVMFSPPFRQNKSAGKGDKQREIISSKRITIVEAFKGGQLTDKPAFFEMMRMAYQNIFFSTTDDARMYIILRNYIRKNREVDEIGEHLNALKIAGWKTNALYVRDLVRPTAFQAWKLKKDPNMCWTRNEYVLECFK